MSSASRILLFVIRQVFDLSIDTVLGKINWTGLSLGVLDRWEVYFLCQLIN